MNTPHTLTRRHALLAALAGVSSAPTLLGAAQPAEDAALRSAIADPQRSDANRARDGARHPYETLRFFGLQPTHAVLELQPGGGWYTEILAPCLRASGRYHAAVLPEDGADERAMRTRFEARLAKDPGAYDRVVVHALTPGTEFVPALAPASLDLVLTFRNVHNWIEDKQQLDDILRACHRVLKPGGALGVVDHRAAPNTSLERMVSSGYVAEVVMQERAARAGFTLAARSEINANPRDNHEHPKGVWSLPPTLAGGAVDRASFVAIGESDRFTHRYVKAA